MDAQWKELKIAQHMCYKCVKYKNRPNITLTFVKFSCYCSTITAFAYFPMLDLFWNCGVKLNILPTSGVLGQLTGTAPEGFLQYDITHQCDEICPDGKGIATHGSRYSPH